MPNATKVRTIQDIYDGMTPEKKEAADLIVGAADEDTPLPEDSGVQAVYDSFTDEEKHFVDFIVGANSIAPSEAAHGDLDGFLAHHGVKGMHWGVRKGEISGKSSDGLSNIRIGPQNTKALRERVKAGTSNLGEAHLAALKSKGHRITNGILGDKTYWKRAAIIAGVTGLGVGAAFAAPALLPAASLAAIGAHAAGTAGVAGGHVVVNGALTTTAALGQQILTGALVGGAATAGQVAGFVNSANNIVRATRGNARINKSLNALGKHSLDSQQSGSKQVQKILRRDGGLKKSVVTHSEGVENFLAHHGVRGMKWGVRKSDSIGVSNLASGGSRVVVLPSKTGAAAGSTNAGTGRTGRNTATTTHHIAKQLSSGPKSEAMWSKIEADINGVVGKSGKLTPKNASAVNELVAKHLTEAANQHTKKGTSARVMASISLNKKMNPSGDPMLHLLVAKNKEDIDAYVDSTRTSLNGSKPGTDPAKNWIVHALSTNDVEVLELRPIIGPRGFIIGIKDQEIAHMEDVENFLAHYGVKGMHWGVRRNLDSGGGGYKTKKDATIKVDDKGKVSVSGGTFKDRRVIRKNADKIIAEQEAIKNLHVSADTERALHTMTKAPHEMSDRELKEMNNRAQQLQQYNKLFGVENKSALQQQVEQLRLQKEYSQLKRELTPEKKSAVKSLINVAGAGFSGYKTIDAATGGMLSKGLVRKMGLEAPISAAEKLKQKNEMLKLRTVNVERNAELNQVLALKGRLATGDPDPVAGFGGKHRVGGGRHMA